MLIQIRTLWDGSSGWSPTRSVSISQPANDTQQSTLHPSLFDSEIHIKQVRELPLQIRSDYCELTDQ